MEVSAWKTTMCAKWMCHRHFIPVPPDLVGVIGLPTKTQTCAKEANLTQDLIFLSQWSSRDGNQPQKLTQRKRWWISSCSSASRAGFAQRPRSCQPLIQWHWTSVYLPASGWIQYLTHRPLPKSWVWAEEEFSCFPPLGKLPLHIVSLLGSELLLLRHSFFQMALPRKAALRVWGENLTAESLSLQMFCKMHC